MENKITQEIPPWSDMKPKTAEFDTMDELTAISWVKNWASGDDFHRLSLSGNALMSEMNGGRKWWVIGYIARPDLLDLPKWVAVESPKVPDDGREVKLMFDGVELKPASGEFVEVKREDA